MKQYFVTLLLFSLIYNKISAENINLFKTIDTIKVEITPAVYITNDTIFHCYISKGENLFFVNKKQLENYLQIYSGKMYEKDKNDDFKTHIKTINLSKPSDTLFPVLNIDFDYVVNGDFIKDSRGIPILWYDLQSAYLFKLYKESYSNKYIYLANIKTVTRSDFKYWGDRFYTLMKIDLTQDSVCNFYFFTKSSSWTMDSLLIDSISISKRKLDKIKKNIELLSPYKGELKSTTNDSNIDILIVDNIRYIPKSQFPPLNKEGGYSIGLIKKYARKYFDLPYYKKK